MQVLCVLPDASGGQLCDTGSWTQFSGDASYVLMILTEIPKISGLIKVLSHNIGCLM